MIIIINGILRVKQFDHSEASSTTIAFGFGLFTIILIMLVSVIGTAINNIIDNAAENNISYSKDTQKDSP